MVRLTKNFDFDRKKKKSFPGPIPEMYYVFGPYDNRRNVKNTTIFYWLGRKCSQLYENLGLSKSWAVDLD
jgi:hypothetical protein